MKINLFSSNSSDRPVLHIDPFKKDNVTTIRLRYSKLIFKDNFVWRGEILFKNGNTSGEQEFEENELPDILMKMQEFLDSL
jgi:hypothetical protein